MNASGRDPSRAEVTEADLLAYVDGRLDAERTATVEAHLADHSEDAARIAADLAIQAGLRMLFGALPETGFADDPPVPHSPSRWRLMVVVAAVVGSFAGGWLAAHGTLGHALAQPPTVTVSGRS
jgi:anti-sigma factor RsiW